MFGFKPKTDEVLNHWVAFADIQVSAQEFYRAIEAKLAELEIPGLEVSRIEYAEGGLLSNQRTYLRLLRERLAFDMCAAPFGTGYFFSCRTVHSPVVLKLWHVLAVLGFLAGVYFLFVRYLGVTFAAIAVAGFVLASAQVFRNTLAMKIADLDAALIKMPAVGPFYERFFRVDSYFRQDTRLMYLESVPRIVQELAEEMAGAKGVKLVRQYSHAPVLGHIYRPRRPLTLYPPYKK
jgi:hypothetical protein